MSKKREAKNKDVLVAVLKSKGDLGILLKNRWYRVPAERLPKRKFKYIAFYQPRPFGKRGKRIEYYARVIRKKKAKRIDLLPEQAGHPRANNQYLKFELGKIKKLARPVKNIVPRRVSFGFTNLKSLFSAKDVLELYGVPPTEQIVEKRLKRQGLKVFKEYPVSKNGRRYRIDLVVFGKRGPVAVECDNDRAHGTKAQKKKDKIKDSFLRRNGWRVVRLRERDILENLDGCVKKVALEFKSNKNYDIGRLGRRKK